MIYILKITLEEVIFRGLPEAIMFNMGVYAFSKKRLDKKTLLLGSIIMLLIMILVRLLPITYGLHTPIIMISAIAIFQRIHETSMILATKAVTIVSAIEVMCELINILGIRMLEGKQLVDIVNNSVQKMMYSSPSLVLSSTIIVLSYMLLKKNKLLE